MPRAGTWVRAYEIPAVGTAAGPAFIPYTELEFWEPIGQVGKGRITVPAVWPRIAEVIDPATDLGRLLKVYVEGEERAAFFADEMSKPYDEPGRGLLIDIYGPTVAGGLDHAVIRPYDGKNPTQAPDWVWGGPDIIGDGDFEQSEANPSVYELYNDGTGGSYQLQIFGDTTAAIAYNASAATVIAEIEALPGVVGVAVRGAGTPTDKFYLEFLDPAVVEDIVLLDSVTGGTTNLMHSSEGEIVGGTGYYSPVGWTISQDLIGGNPKVHGAYDAFEISTDQAHGGTSSLYIVPGQGNGYPGGQKVIEVTPGQIYQAAGWVYPTDSADDFRFVLRTIAGTFIAADPSALGGNSYSAGSWHEMAIADVVIPDGVTHIIVRAANVTTTPGGQDPFYLDDFTLRVGFAETTIGEILTVLKTEALDGDLDWLGFDFDEVNDSAGQPWVRNEALTAAFGRNMRQIMDLVSNLGYEWRVRPDGAGGYQLQVYNPLGMGTDRTTTGPAILSGGPLAAPETRRSLHEANFIISEGGGGTWAESTDSGSVAGIGRRGHYERDEAIDPTSVPAWAAAQLDDYLARDFGFKTALYDADSLRPYEHFDLGDTLIVNMATKVGQAKDIPRAGYRVKQIGYQQQVETRIWPLAFSREILEKAHATTETLYRLIRKWEDQVRPRTTQPLQPQAGGGGAPTVVVASINTSSAMSRGKADLLCSGSDDGAVIEAAFGLAGNSGRVIVCEGHYSIVIPAGGYGITVPEGCLLIGLGDDTVLEAANDGGAGSYVVRIECASFGDCKVVGIGSTGATRWVDCGT